MGLFGDISSSIEAVCKNTLEETNKNNSIKEETNKNNNIKNVKFEILVDDLAEYFCRLYEIGDVNPLKLVFDAEDVNEVARYAILNAMMTDDEEEILYSGYDSSDLIIENINNTGIKGIKELIKECRRKPEVKYRFIFWSIFIIAIDENAYNEKLSDISDIAYLIGFTEEMLKDWITALKLILEGKGFKNYLYSSKEANQFFGHR